MQTYNGCLSRAPVAKVFWSRTWRINNDFRQNPHPHARIQGEHPAGGCCFRAIGQTSAPTQTLPGRQLSAGLCVLDSMADTWVKVSRLSGLPSPKQQTVLLGKHKGSYVFFVNQHSLYPLLCFLTWFCYYEGFEIQKNCFRYKCSKNCVCRTSFCNYQE